MVRIKKKNYLSMSNKKKMVGFLFTLPSIIGIIWLFIGPMIYSLIMSFSDVKFDMKQRKAVTTFIGLKNYIYALTQDPAFNRCLLIAFSQLINVAIIVFFSFFAATLINSKFRGRSIARFIFFLPLVITSATIMTLDSTDVFQQAMLNSSFKSVDNATGFLQSIQMGELLKYTGLPKVISDYLLTGINSVFKTISLSGVQIIIILAALQSVPRSLYEMAIVEGATSWEIFWKITFVLISPMLLICVLYSIIDSFTAYDNWVLGTIKRIIIISGNYGIASAMSWIYFAAITAVIGVVAFAGSKLVFYYDK